MSERDEQHADDDLASIRRLPIVREIGVELRALAAEEDLRATRRPLWRRRPLLSGLVAAVVIAAPAAAAIGGLWSPDADPVPMSTVATPASEIDPAAACAPPPGLARGRIGTTDATPPDALTERFGVLRRTQRPVDRVGLRQPAARTAPGAIATGTARLLGTDPAGHRHWLIASLETPAPATAQCPGAATAPRWHLTVVGDDGSSGSSGYREVLRTPTFSAGNPDQRPGQSIVTGIVPDGVRSVTVTYPGDPDPGRTWPVADNFFSFAVALDVPEAASARITWNTAP